jgi:hypothetical protein
VSLRGRKAIFASEALFRGAGKNQEAESAWKTIAQQQPSDPEPYAHLGLLEAQQEHYPEGDPLL